MKTYKRFLVALLSGLLLIGLSACEKGPAEKAGEAASNVADKSEEAAETVKEKLDSQ